jgi:hypothetical protein
MRLSFINAHNDTEHSQAESHTHGCDWSEVTTHTQRAETILQLQITPKQSGKMGIAKNNIVVK